MNQDVRKLSDALDAVRAKLIRMPQDSNGFGEVRAIYRDLTEALIVAGDKSDAELASEMARVSAQLASEWASNKAMMSGWLDVLQPVVDAVSTLILSGGVTGLANGLKKFI